MFPSILTFDFDLILGSFLTFLGPNGLFLGSVQGSKTFLLIGQSLRQRTNFKIMFLVSYKLKNRKLNFVFF